jgi:hypothetical protein
MDMDMDMACAMRVHVACAWHVCVFTACVHGMLMAFAWRLPQVARLP